MMGESQQPESPDSSDKVSITIEIDADGTISVGQGSEAEAGGMQDLSQPPAENESGMQQVGSIDEALSIARQMLQSGMPASEQGSADSAFQARRPARQGFQP